MKDVVDLPRDEDVVGDVVLNKLEIGVAGEVLDVAHVSGNQVVDSDDLVAFGEEPIGKMRPEEPSTSGDNSCRFFCGA